MPPERWGPSWGLRMLAAVQMIAYAGLGGLVHAGALVLRVVYGATGVAVVLIGAVLLYRAWHSRRMAGQPG